LQKRGFNLIDGFAMQRGDSHRVIAMTFALVEPAALNSMDELYFLKQYVSMKCCVALQCEK
jgi:hypothetical protein